MNFDKLTTICNNETAVSIMNSVVDCVMKLLEDKQVLSDDILVLCFEYCTRVGGQSAKTKEFVKLLQKITKECVGRAEANPNCEIYQQTRDYAWFKEFLLTSNVLLLDTSHQATTTATTATPDDDDVKVKNSADKPKIIGDSSQLVYDYVNMTVNEELKWQKEYIANEVRKEEEMEADSWKELCHFKEFQTLNPLRQDRIENGIKPGFEANTLWMLAPNIDNKNFHVFEESNLKNYLSTLLIHSQSLNHQFQDCVRTIFSSINPDCLIVSAPTKLEERAQIKAQTGLILFVFILVLFLAFCWRLQSWFNFVLYYKIQYKI